MTFSDSTVGAFFYGGVFLVPLIAVLWLWYDSSGRIGSSRWAWRVILTALVVLTTPAVALGAANLEDQGLMATFGWLAIGSGVLAILGVVAYAIWGRSPSEEYADDAGYPEPLPPLRPAIPTAPEVAAVPAASAATIPAPPVTPMPAAGPVGAYLFIKSGANQGLQFPVGNQVTIGRGAGCDITLADSRVSAEHGQLKRQGGTYVYLDLKSTNGSFLLVEGREERLRSSQALVDGDELRLGGTVLKFIRTADGGNR